MGTVRLARKPLTNDGLSGSGPGTVRLAQPLNVRIEENQAKGD